MRTLGTPLPADDARCERRRKALWNSTLAITDLEAGLRQGGPEKYRLREHQRGKMLARERVTRLLDEGSHFLEVGLLAAHDMYDGKAPAAGVVTGVGRVHGREVVVVANDATVKSGSWWPETITKMLRAQEIAMRCRVPIVYLVDSAGVNLPYQDGVFPGQYGAARIFHYNSIMRRLLHIPQFAAVMGQCVAGGAYLPALSDVLIMTRGTSFMGLGGPKLVYGALREKIDSETLGGAHTHNAISGVAHYEAADDAGALAHIRELIQRLPPATAAGLRLLKPEPPRFNPAEIYALIPERHTSGYDMYEVLARILDRSQLDEYQKEFAAELITGHAYLEGIPVGVLANQRLPIQGRNHQEKTLRLGGVFYPESARKAAEFIQLCERQGTPLLFIQDVTGFMVGSEAEHAGIIRAGADMVEAMATATVPKVTLTVGHASGAGYYAMAGQGFDPDFMFTWPCGRMGVMEGASAVQALFGGQLARLQADGRTLDDDPELKDKVDKTLADYEQNLSAVAAGARGYVDAVVPPRETRTWLGMALRTSLNNPGPHLGNFQLMNAASRPAVAAMPAAVATVPAARAGKKRTGKSAVPRSGGRKKS
ncbi:MAG: acyl-CoA carboxylase subunit beta [Acidobacteria bacterium]|nr:acyl-CoA carboxylase subunit beta [Acidobacteriota bacterium]